MEDKVKFRPDAQLRLMDLVRQVLHYHHYAYRTEQTYCDWVLRFIKLHGGQTRPKFEHHVLRKLFLLVGEPDLIDGSPAGEDRGAASCQRAQERSRLLILNQYEPIIAWANTTVLAAIITTGNWWLAKPFF
jgi:hypothetical protein